MRPITILSVLGKDKLETTALHLVKCYSVPILTYACQVWNLSPSEYKTLNVIWNNSFRKIFNCCWRDNTAGLQFYCNCRFISHIVDQQSILFYKRILRSSNVILCTLLRSKQSDIDGDPDAPSPKGEQSPPNFRPMAGWMNLVLGMEVGLSPGDFVLDGDPVPFPQFSAYFYCGQTAACIKMTLGIALGLGPGEFVLDGDPAPSPKRGRAPSPILRAEFENFKIAPEVRALPVIANFVALEQQRILVKTRSESV